ncbi:ATP-binding protein [Microbacterium sp. BK668]|uniref:sensor histidine kinase n=1 Tax=Microbacterium sp. BK668 TaxID=2512118 RepID=UPI00105FDFE5|nr:ATP-binding protein [Microbacterium sp. BK668]TDN90746.1 signal transduction histidine kinase [Microbacterium sp. BK668]
MIARAWVADRSTTTAISVGIPVLGVAVGIPAALASPSASSYVSWFPDFLVGLLFFAAAGLSSRSSRVLTIYALLIGCLWFLGSALPVASLWHRGAIAHLVIALPLIAVAPWFAVVAVVAGYAVNLIPSFGGRPDVSLALAAALIVVALLRMRTRRSGSAPLAVALAFGIGVAGYQVLGSIVPGPTGVYAGLLVYDAAIAAIAFILALSTLRPDVSDPADLIIEIRRRSPAAEAAQALRDALGDVDDPAIIHALATADRLAATNARLQREADGRLRALAESLDRLAAADTEERARILDLLSEELDPLYSEVDAALAALPPSPASERIRQRVAESADELAALRADLSAAGDPSLADGILRLASQSPIPVRVGDLPRLPLAWVEPVLRMCAEAMTNAVKHSGATTIRIGGRRRRGAWTLDVVDDGRGGADERRGTGLRGMIERASEIGARIEVTSPVEGGTWVSIRLPRFSGRVVPRRPSADGRAPGARTPEQGAR